MNELKLLGGGLASQLSSSPTTTAKQLYERRTPPPLLPPPLSPLPSPTESKLNDVEKLDEEAKLRAGIVELKERKLSVKIPRRKEVFLNILAINQYAYIHAKQIIVLLGVSQTVLDQMLKGLVERAQASTDGGNGLDYYIRIELTEATRDIFGWLNTRVGLDTANLTSVNMLRYDKLDIFFDNLLVHELAVRYKDLVKKAKQIPITNN